MVRIKERLVEIGGAVLGSTVPHIIYEVSGRTVDIRDALPLRALFTGLGGFAGHLVVSALHGIINVSQVKPGEDVTDTNESVPSEVWLSLKQPPPLNRTDDRDK